MPWEQGKRGRPYYRRKVRDGEKVRSEYIGGGLLGEIAAQFDILQRQERESTREERRARLAAIKASITAEDAETDAYCKAVDDVLKEAMEAAGYHRRKRGSWRKKRHESK